jgi:hypothetical protein
MLFTVEVENREHLARALAQIAEVKGVFSAVRR